MKAQASVDNTENHERPTSPPVHIRKDTFASRLLIMAVLEEPHCGLKQDQTGDCHDPDDGVIAASQIQCLCHGYADPEPGDCQGESQELKGRMDVDDL